MDISVKGQRVLITAGAAGIGRAMTDVFHKAGARVHICDVVQGSLEETGQAFLGGNRTLWAWFSVDLNGMFYCTRLAVPMIKAAGGGAIINLSSAAGRLGFPFRTPYA